MASRDRSIAWRHRLVELNDELEPVTNAFVRQADPNRLGATRVLVLGAVQDALTSATRSAVLAHPGTELVDVIVERAPLSVLRAAAPDILLVVSHAWKVGPKGRAIARLGTLGLHPGALPRYRGSYPLWWALRNQERDVGLTLYELDDQMDTGPILGQALLAVRSGDTFAKLDQRIAELAPILVGEFLDYVALHRALPPRRAQDERLASCFGTPTVRERVRFKLWWWIRSIVERDDQP